MGHFLIRAKGNRAKLQIRRSIGDPVFNKSIKYFTHRSFKDRVTAIKWNFISIYFAQRIFHSDQIAWYWCKSEVCLNTMETWLLAYISNNLESSHDNVSLNFLKFLSIKCNTFTVPTEAPEIKEEPLQKIFGFSKGIFL